MKNIYVIGLKFFLPFCIFAQDKVSIPSNDIIIGRNYITNVDITAKKYEFPNKIYGWNLNDSTKTFTIQLRGTSDNEPDSKGILSDLKNTGDILLFDIQTGQIKWKHLIDYKGSTIDQYDRILIKSNENNSSCLNIENGEELWNTNRRIEYINSEKGIGIGIKRSSSGGMTNIVEGVNLKTGQSIWKRKINMDYNLNEFLPLNDSVVVVSANGLHTINLVNGKGWDYDAKTGKKDHSNTVLSNLFNFTLSIITNNEFELSTGHDLITGMVSNTLVDSTGIYMANKNSIVRLDKEGNVLWKNNLPVEMVSRSTLFFKDSMIYMVNDGFGFINYETVNYGKTFVAGFSKLAGKKTFLNKVGYKKEQILSYLIQQDTLFLLSKNRVFKYSLHDGNELNEQIYKTDSLGEFTQLGGSDLFISSDSATISPIRACSTDIVVYTGKNQVLVLDNQLNIKNNFQDNDVYYCILESKGYKFINVGETIMVINKSNNIIAELDISGNILLNGKKLFEVQGNNLLEIDMDQLISN